MVSLPAEVATLKSEPVPPSPFRRMEWGEPAASSRIRIDPNRVPAAVGIKLTENTQLLAAAKLLPQSFVCAKSWLVVVDKSDNAELPMFGSRTLCTGLVEPTACMTYCKDVGLTDAVGAASAPIFSRKALVLAP